MQRGVDGLSQGFVSTNELGRSKLNAAGAGDGQPSQIKKACVGLTNASENFLVCLV